jgi:hypothetical protein
MKTYFISTFPLLSPTKIMTKLLQIYIQLCVLSGFHHEADENCSPLGYYAASSGNFLPSLFGFSLLKMGPTGCPKISVRNYLYSQLNNPEEHSFLSLTNMYAWVQLKR